MRVLDTNIILRYIVKDNEEQLNKITPLINKTSYVTVEVIAEVVYGLTKYYNISRQETSKLILGVLEEINAIDYDVVVCSLETYAKTSLDYIDCVLIARNKILNDEIITFDKKLKARLFMEEERGESI